MSDKRLAYQQWISGERSFKKWLLVYIRRYILLLPVVLLFFCTVLPNFMRMLDGEYIGFWGKVYSGFFSIVFALYVFLIVYCTAKLKKIRSRYKD